MGRVISIGDYSPDTVELWPEEGGQSFVLRQRTRKVMDELAAHEATEPGEDAGNDAQIKWLAEQIDFVLEPATGENGRKVKPSTVIVRKWKENKVSVDALLYLLNEIKGSVQAPN